MRENESEHNPYSPSLRSILKSIVSVYCAQSAGLSAMNEPYVQGKRFSSDQTCRSWIAVNHARRRKGVVPECGLRHMEFCFTHLTIFSGSEIASTKVPVNTCCSEVRSQTGNKNMCLQGSETSIYKLKLIIGPTVDYQRHRSGHR